MPNNIRSITISGLSLLSITDRNQLPPVSAVYFAVDEDQKIHYIGQTKNLKGRIATHHKLANFQSLNLAIAWIPVDVELLRIIEKKLIQHHKPTLNHHLQRKKLIQHHKPILNHDSQDKCSPSQIKVSLGSRREIIEKIAQDEGRSLSQTICLLLDIFLTRQDEISESAKKEKRTFLDMAQIRGKNAFAAFLLKDFVKQEFSESGLLKLLEATVKPSPEFIKSFSLDNQELEQ